MVAGIVWDHPHQFCAGDPVAHQTIANAPYNFCPTSGFKMVMDIQVKIVPGLARIDISPFSVIAIDL